MNLSTSWWWAASRPPSCPPTGVLSWRLWSMWQFHDAQLALRNQKRYEHLHTDQWFQSFWCFQYISTPLFHCMHWPRPSRPPWRTRTWTRSRGRVDIENNITLEPEAWIKIFVAFFKAEQHGNVTELILVFWSYQSEMTNHSFTECSGRRRAARPACPDVSPPPQGSIRGGRSWWASYLTLRIIV